MIDPLVSVIIPSFNSKSWICESLESVFRQTYNNIQIIVIDDGSTDGTQELLESKYGTTIDYIYQANKGLSGARNTGIQHALGEFIQLLDADDLLCPDKITQQVKALAEHTDYSVAYSDFEYFEDDAPETSTPSPQFYRTKYKSGNLWKDFLTGNFIVCHAALARKEDVIAAGGFDESLRACEDYDLWMRMAARGNTFIFTDGVMARYRRTPGSMSSARPRQIQWTIDVLKKNIRQFGLNDKEESYLARHFLASLYSELGNAYFKEELLTKAVFQLFRAVKLTPGNWRKISRTIFPNRYL